ncbi:JAB domain-containing protein, partial [Dysgonomonas capnocytophagoides]|uniref:MuF-C-terminal domain-containing protein n=1 Tax=Dysgonomonas capnocytophagoides TaxID=45254 RepID=UPI002A7FA258
TARLQNVGPSSENKDNESVIEKQEDKAENTENTPVNVPRARIRHLDGKEYTGDIVKEYKGRVTIKDDISGREISVPKKRVIERFEQSNTNDHLTQQDERSNVDPLLSIPLRKLKKGEFSYVERVFTENKLFSFTGAEKIESAEDVVYIFKELENASVENVFMVLIKDGISTVQHLGIGGYCSAMVNTPAVWESYKRLNPDKVYFVHNHPAGNLEASRMDQNTLKNLRSIFGDKLQPGIIINLKSGKYGQFSESDSWSEEKSKRQINEVPIKIYSFNKQVFDADFDPESLFQIKTSDDVASFISSHRLGDRKKISFLVLNNNNQVVGNFFTGYTKLTDKNIGNLSDYIVRHINRYGGQNAILYGDFSLDPFINRKLDRVIKEKSGNGFNLLDVIKCSGNNSAISVMETPSVYENARKESAKEKEEISSNVRFRNTPEIINDRFNKELQQQIEGTLPKGHVYYLGNPNNILRCAGIPDLSIELAASKLSLKASKTYESNHPFELSAVMNLPGAIQNPIAVFDSKTRAGSKVIMTELTNSEGNHFIIAMQTNIPKNRYGTRTIQINDIRSVYPKDNIRDIVNWINRGDLLKWVDKTKLGNWLAQQRSNSAEVATPVSEFDVASKIVENYENPTLLEGEISSKVDRMSDELRVKVNKVKDRGDLPEGIQERMKDGRYPGLFDPRTGKVWIITNEITDVADAEATMLHEIIGHKGIHGLFGDKLPEFCKKVLDSLQADERAQLLKEYNGNEQLAAEEYIARFAEGYENSTMWEKVKAIVKEFFREVGIDLKLSDNDLKYILWKGKNRLKEGEGILEIIEKTARNREIERKLWGRDVREESIEEVNQQFNKELDDLTEENADEIVFNLGRPSSLLLASGITDRPIKLYGNKVVKKIKKHGYFVSDLKNLPLAIQNPLTVFKGNNPGGYSILTEMELKGNKALVAINIGKGKDADFNIVATVFGKGYENIVDWINSGKLLYVNKEKTANLLYHPANVRKLPKDEQLSSATNIVENFENPKLEDRILFRKAPDKDFSRRHLNFAERARAELQDRMLSVKMLLDEVKRRGGKVTDYANPYIA